jgi:coiled-coil domain-containing protein 64
MLQINSQLMEAIQQKIELSEQLEQWQMDMQTLLDEHLRSKLAPASLAPTAATGETRELVAAARKKRTSTGSKKRFGIF